MALTSDSIGLGFPGIARPGAASSKPKPRKKAAEKNKDPKLAPFVLKAPKKGQDAMKATKGPACPKPR
jgi:hypothetical protein